MIAPRTALFAITSVICACSSGTSTLTIAHADAIRDSVQSMLDDFRRYAATRQYDSLIGLYVGDTTLRWIEDGQLRLRSSEALKGYYGALPPTTSIEMHYDSLEITPLTPGAASVLIVVSHDGQRFDARRLHIRRSAHDDRRASERRLAYRQRSYVFTACSA